jgi:hypothetical protein
VLCSTPRRQQSPGRAPSDVVIAAAYSVPSLGSMKRACAEGRKRAPPNHMPADMPCQETSAHAVLIAGHAYGRPAGCYSRDLCARTVARESPVSAGRRGSAGFAARRSSSATPWVRTALPHQGSRRGKIGACAEQRNLINALCVCASQLSADRGFLW